MAFYYNENFKGVQNVQSGPYTFKYGLIQTSEQNDATVGPILVNFYGCKKVKAETATKILKQHQPESAETSKVENLSAQEAAAKTAEEAKKAAVEAEREAEIKAAEELAAKNAANTGDPAKPEDKM